MKNEQKNISHDFLKALEPKSIILAGLAADVEEMMNPTPPFPAPKPAKLPATGKAWVVEFTDGKTGLVVCDKEGNAFQSHQEKLTLENWIDPDTIAMVIRGATGMDF